MRSEYVNTEEGGPVSQNKCDCTIQPEGMHNWMVYFYSYIFLWYTTHKDLQVLLQIENQWNWEYIEFYINRKD